MIKIILALSFSFCSTVWAEAGKEVSGTVSLSKALEAKPPTGGVLFVFAKNAGGKAGDGAPPVAVLRIPEPKFPVAFSLSAQNLMMQGTEFKGPFTVYARYSPTGDAIDKSGPQGQTAKAVKVGQKDVKVELK